MCSASSASASRASREGTPPPSNGTLRLDTAPDLWASADIEHSPSLEFLLPKQVLILNPADADRLGLGPDELVRVGSNGHAVEAAVRIREAARRGTAYLLEGTAEDNPNALVNGGPVLVEVEKPPSGEEA